MTTQFATAKQLLLDVNAVTEQNLHEVLSDLLKPGVDYADIYLQFSKYESWLLEDSIVKSGHFGIDRGVGVRAVSGEQAGFAYANDMHLAALQKAAQAASGIAKSGKTLKLRIPTPVTMHNLYQDLDPQPTFTEQQKIELLQSIDREARAADSRVKQVIASLSGEYEVILLASSDGVLAADVRPLVDINVSVIVEDKNRREQGSAGGGGRAGYELIAGDTALNYAKEAVRIALVNLHAKAAPAGNMLVVLGPGWPGVLLHEAVGHGLEGDFNRKKCSIYANRIGEQVAAKGCNIVDNGSLEGQRRGSLNIDDEGTRTQCTELIVDGVLRNYMQDKLNARLMGMQSTGNCRRESYAHLPIVRMTNTYMLPGKYDPQEIIGSVERGLYAVNFSGGQVDITSGNFVFTTSEAYLIEHGKLTTPVSKATLTGNGPEVLNRVTMVGSDLQLDPGIGMCGKEGQSVPVGVGQPTLKVSELIVGGSVG